MNATIGIHGLRVEAHVGWEAAERHEPQGVRFDVELRLPEPPRARETDALTDTVDYARVCDALRGICHGVEYRLLERLAAAAHAAIGPLVPAGTRIRLTITKERPPIEGLSGGASVTLDDGA